MNTRLLALLLLFALPLFACGGDDGPASAPGTTGTLPNRGTAFALPAGDTVAGRSLQASEDGVWVVRRVGRAPETSDGVAPVTRGGGGGGRGGMYRGPGESVPPGLREPTDPTPPPAAPPSGPPTAGAPGTPAPVAPTPTSPRPSPAPTFGASDDGEVVESDADVLDALVEKKREASDAAGATRTKGARGPANRPAQPSLKAGSTDDNEDFDAFVTFLATWADQEGVADRYVDLDVGDRRFLRVLDGAGRPVPGARVHVVDEVRDAAVWSGTTYGDGRVPFYPGVVADRLGGEASVPEGGWLVEVRVGDVGRLVRWDGEGGELVVTLDGAPPFREPIALDVGILLDTTGSMGDEIARIKATLLQVTERLRGLDLEFDLRYGAVLYRDLGDAYVTSAHAFTEDIEAFSGALQGVEAQGGGDGPESLNQGLAEAVGGLAWRPNAAKVLFLIADAPPHMDYEGDVTYGDGALAAVDKGIRVHTVAASGLDRFGSLVFRQIAQMARGKFIFIEYGSPAQSAASHGVGGPTKSNNLDDILFEQIQNELDGWGRPDPVPDPAASELPASGETPENETR